VPRRLLNTVGQRRTLRAFLPGSPRDDNDRVYERFVCGGVDDQAADRHRCELLERAGIEFGTSGVSNTGRTALRQAAAAAAWERQVAWLSEGALAELAVSVPRAAMWR